MCMPIGKPIQQLEAMIQRFILGLELSLAGKLTKNGSPAGTGSISICFSQPAGSPHVIDTGNGAAEQTGHQHGDVSSQVESFATSIPSMGPAGKEERSNTMPGAAPTSAPAFLPAEEHVFHGIDGMSATAPHASAPNWHSSLCQCRPPVVKHHSSPAQQTALHRFVEP